MQSIPVWSMGLAGGITDRNCDVCSIGLYVGNSLRAEEASSLSLLWRPH